MTDDRSAMLAPDAPAAETALDQDVPCLRCGCNLRGTDRDGRCPQCQAPLGLSLQENHLRLSRPDWVAKLELSMRLMMWTILICILAGLLPKSAAMTLQRRVGMAAVVVAAAAAWLFTAGQRYAREIRSEAAVRRGLRICAMLSAAGLFLVILEAPAALAAIVAHIVIWLIVASIFLLCAYLQMLSLRIPAESLPPRTLVIMGGLTIASGALFVVTLVPALGRAGFLGWIPEVAKTALPGIWWLVLLLQYRKVFESAHRQAGLNWQGAVSAGGESHT